VDEKPDYQTHVMNTLTDTLKKAGDEVVKDMDKGLPDSGNVVGQLGRQSETSSDGAISDPTEDPTGQVSDAEAHKGGYGVFNLISSGAATAFAPAAAAGHQSETSSNGASGAISDPTRQVSDAEAHNGGGGLFNLISSGAATVFAPAAAVAGSGAALVRDSTLAGMSIAQHVGQSGLDMGVNLATGTATFAGTALGGVVEAASETSGAVFEPVGSGLRAIEGLEKLGQGVNMINGLPLGAVRQVRTLTTKALNMSGMVRVISMFYENVAEDVMTHRHPPSSTLMEMESCQFQIRYVGWSYLGCKRQKQSTRRMCSTEYFRTQRRKNYFPKWIPLCRSMLLTWERHAGGKIGVVSRE